MSVDAHPDAPSGERNRAPAQHDEPAVDLDRTGAANGDGAKSEAAAIDPAALWSFRQIEQIGFQVALVLIVFAVVGFAFRSPDSTYVARTEFVYTLDESVPDSFLREDRRLLTQMATLQSDAVLAPVAESFDITVDDLRESLTIETVDLSEVLRLDVSDGDPDRALAVNRAVIARYVVLAAEPPPAELSDALRARQAELVESLADADSALITLERNRLTDPALATAQESLERQIAYRTDQINRIQALLDDSIVTPVARSRRTRLSDELVVAQGALAVLETDLADLRTSIAEQEAETSAELALLRDIDRLEDELGTIDGELARRDLRPLIASPIRVLGEPTVGPSQATWTRLRGLTIGLLVAIPFAGALAYRTRKRQLWFEQ